MWLFPSQNLDVQLCCFQSSLTGFDVFLAVESTKNTNPEGHFVSLTFNLSSEFKKSVIESRVFSPGTHLNMQK